MLVLFLKYVVIITVFSLWGLNALQAQVAPALHPKLDAAFTELLGRQGQFGTTILNLALKPRLDAEGVARYPAIIHTDNPVALLQEGIQVNSIFGKVATAHLTLQELARLADRPDVTAIRAPGIRHTLNDVSNAELGVYSIRDGLLNNGLGYTGRGVVVCIYDTGIDWRNLDFRNSDDTTKTRIKYIWDQTLTPQGAEHTAGNGLNYGVEYTEANINAALALTTDSARLATVREDDTQGHGTHVAGTAVGNGTSYLAKNTGYPYVRFGKYCGVAPEADIIAIRGSVNGSFATNNIIDGLTYAAAKAAELGEPIVINLSLGGHQGFHDGTDDDEAAIDNFSKTAGHIAAVAAGNEGNDLIHSSGTMAANAATNIAYTVGGYTPQTGANNDYLDVFVALNTNVALTATLTPPPGLGSPITLSPVQSGTSQTPSPNIGSVTIEKVVSATGKAGVHFRVDDSQSEFNGPVAGRYIMSVTPVSGTPLYDAWSTGSSIGKVDSLYSTTYPNDNSSVAMPGTADSAITVGSYISRVTWPSIDGHVYRNAAPYYNPVDSLSLFSSHGPTVDGRIKPDITGPGQSVVSTLAKSIAAAKIAGSKPYVAFGGKAFVEQGTSQATPHIAGVVALMLQVNRNLTANGVKAIFANATVANRFASIPGALPNNSWGYGQLDAINAVAKAVNPANSIRISRYADYNGAFTKTADSIKGPSTLVFGQAAAQRFTLNDSGFVIGAYIYPYALSSTRSKLSYLTSKGHAVLSLYANNTGNLPGTLLGKATFPDSVSTPILTLTPNMRNYINLMPLALKLKAGSYHLVLATAAPADTLQLRTDSSGSSARASFNPGTGWQAHTNNWAMELVVVSTNNTVITGLPDSIPNRTPLGLFLGQNYPNPAIGDFTLIPFSLTVPGHATLKVYDLSGREVATLAEGNFSREPQTASFPTRNLPPGEYVYRLESAGGTLALKMVIAH